MNMENNLNLPTWEDFKYKHLQPEMIAESEFLSALLGEFIRARDELKITQEQLATMTGLKQAAISRMERGDAVPRIDTLFKLLLPLGKTIAIVPLNGRLAEYAAKTAAANAAKTAEGKPDGKKPRQKRKAAKKDSSSGRKAAEKPAEAVHGTPASHGSGYPAGYSIQAKGGK